MFIGPMRWTDQHYVATIGGNKNSASGMGAVQWRLKDDLRKRHTLDIENVLYFHQLPVNILIITGLTYQIKDNDGTGINTKRNKSQFYWDKNKYQRKINHPPSDLTELPIMEGFLMASMFSKLFGTKVCTTKQFCHCHASTLLPQDDGMKIQAKLNADMLHVGETLLYSNVGHTTYVKFEEIFLDNDAVLQFRVRTKSEELIEATKESLRAPDDPDIGWIPTTIPEKTDEASNLSEDDLGKLTNPVSLSPLQK